jgi:hypothetical protein
MATLQRPTATSGVWIEFGGHRWRAGGKAEDFTEGRFVRHADYQDILSTSRVGRVCRRHQT